MASGSTSTGQKRGIGDDIGGHGAARPIARLAHQVVEVDPHRVQPRLAGKGQKAARQARAALHGRDARGDHLPGVGIAFAFGQKFKIAQDHGQDVVEIMRDPARQLADGRILLRRIGNRGLGPDLGLRGADRRQIDMNSDDPGDPAIGIAFRKPIIQDPAFAAIGMEIAELDLAALAPGAGVIQRLGKGRAVLGVDARGPRLQRDRVGPRLHPVKPSHPKVEMRKPGAVIRVESADPRRDMGLFGAPHQALQRKGRAAEKVHEVDEPRRHKDRGQAGPKERQRKDRAAVIGGTLDDDGRAKDRRQELHDQIARKADDQRLP